MRDFQITECFADDVVKYDRDNGKEYKFWDNFKNINNIEEWKEKGLKIYDMNRYDSLPDPDAYSENLYRFHEKLWNMQAESHRFNVSRVSKINKKCELQIEENSIKLGSDSIMSIYWHWAGTRYPYKNMRESIKNISGNIKNRIEYKNLCVEIKERFVELEVQRYDPEKYNKDSNAVFFKKFIWCYLQKANTIGGFVLFPRHMSSINARRGCHAKICDRFDLTLECIRRLYQYGEFFSEDENPLLGISEEDKTFFRMFGSFEKYASFFCLDKSFDGKQNWVENGHVLSLLDNKPLDDWKFNKNPLPSEGNWWVFFDNIMSRLDARNKQIEKLFGGK